MKQCKKCGETKPLDEFTRDKRKSDGRSTRCKPCHNTMTAAWREEHPDYLREWYLAHRPEPTTHVAIVDGAKLCTACSMTKPLEDFNRHKHGLGGRRAICRACQKQAHHANPEPSRLASRARRQANPTYMRKWRAANRQRLAEYDRQYKLHISNSPYSREFMADLYAQIQALPCIYCHDTGGEVDHVIPLSRGGVHEPDNLAPACRGCNASKGNRLLAEWDGPPKLRYAA